MYLDEALEDGFKIKTPSGDATIEILYIGDLVLSSGQIVASDPFLISGTAPFEDSVEPGKYPIILSIAHIEEDERIALATVQFSKRKPERWRMATTAKPSSRRYTEYGQVTIVEGIYDHIVDYGCSSFADFELASWIAQKMAENDAYIYKLTERMQENYRNTREWAVVHPNPASELDIALFSSGGGDGSYHSFWGLAGEETVCLTTDFQMFEPFFTKENKDFEVTLYSG